MKKFVLIGAGLFIIFALISSVILNLVLIGGNADAFSSSLGADHESLFEEVRLSGSGRDKIAVVELTGVIGYSYTGDIGGNMVDEFVAKMKQVRTDPQIKAVILRVNSPGGEVTASDILYHHVKKTDEIKPVVVFMESVAASGGYYSAIGGRYLMANDLTITGSIGVLMQTFNAEGLAGKVGVSMVTFKSGKLKDLLNPFRPVSEEEMGVVQALIDESYGRFVGLVAEERGLDENELREGIADGRILSGTQALKEKLIDGTGYFEDAVKKAADLAGIREDSKVVVIQAPFNLGKFLKIFGKTEATEVKVNIGPESLRLENGKLYYVSPHLIGQ